MPVRASTGQGSSLASDGALLAEPLTFALAQNSPNPFRGATLIGFSLAERSRVKLIVVDVAGREVASLADGEWEPGRFTLNWSRRGGQQEARPGVYFIRLEATALDGGRRFTSLKKMVLLD